jgi:hypothetical protein
LEDLDAEVEINSAWQRLVWLRIGTVEEFLWIR